MCVERVDVASSCFLEPLGPVPDDVHDRRGRIDVVVVRVNELAFAVESAVRFERNPVGKAILRTAAGGVVDPGSLTFAVHAPADRHDEAVVRNMLLCNSGRDCGPNRIRVD
jgi:hypothetical protein